MTLETPARIEPCHLERYDEALTSLIAELAALGKTGERIRSHASAKASSSAR
mgnify:CR=1 FL=1